MDEAEYALLSSAHKQKILGANDRIQTALGELKDLDCEPTRGHK